MACHVYGVMGSQIQTMETTDMKFTRKGFLGLGGSCLFGMAFGAGQDKPMESPGKVMMGYDETDLGQLDPTPWTPFSDKKVRVGIAGEGVCQFGSQFSYQTHPNAEVVACAELDPAKLKLLQSRVKAKRTYASCEAMIEAEAKAGTMDAVYIATDAPSHCRLAIMALRHGLHVVSAVPAILGEDQLDLIPDLLAAAKASGKVYQMNETTAFRASCYAMRKIYEAGGFGDLGYTEGEYFHHGVGVSVGSYRGWRDGLPPQYYPTHSNGFYTCVTHRRFTEVTCHAVPAKGKGYPNNRYRNPFASEVAYFKCADGSSARMAVCYDMPCIDREAGRCWGQKGSFENDRFQGDAAAIRGVKFLRPQLPPNVEGGGHGGSHGYLTDDFLRAIILNQKPCVDIITALDTTVSGIYAHRSAMKGGETLKIPEFSL